MVAQSLIASGGDVERFALSLSWRMRLWLLGLPAGIGWATLRAIVKMWLGLAPHRSGVFSAGNGPAMRSAILGVALGDDPDRLRSFVAASTRLTHTDPKALHAALAAAVAAHLASLAMKRPVEGHAFLERMTQTLREEDAREFLDLLAVAATSVSRGESTPAFARGLGLGAGVTGYAYHTVPVAIHAWLSHPGDFRHTVLATVECGGDSDTTGAIAGAICGAAVGSEGIPLEWRQGLAEWPRSVAWMESLGRRLARAAADGTPAEPLPLNVPAVLLRNLVFTTLVLAHGLRRLLPPY